MKRQIRFLMVVAASVFTLTAMAEDEIDSSFQFVDEEGNVIDNGSTITRTEITDDGFQDPFISSGLYVKNTTDANVGVAMDVTISKMDNGQMNFCFPMSCTYHYSAETFSSDGYFLEASELKDMMTEWFPLAYGECIATFKLKVMDYTEGRFGPTDFVFKAYGPEVTVNFSYPDPAGINGVKVSDSSGIVARYTLQGQRISTPQRGVNIVKYADGRTVKTLIK
ncbi:MAG: hypothetical protein LUD48_04985 [Prevotella sp.]|nr:hypothetical protein [Prevotella sp.]